MSASKETGLEPDTETDFTSHKKRTHSVLLKNKEAGTFLWARYQLYANVLKYRILEL